MSSPIDSMMASKKKRRLAAIAKKEGEKGLNMGINDCDLGASPQMNKGSLIGKKNGGRMSPLMSANKFQMGKKK